MRKRIALLLIALIAVFAGCKNNEVGFVEEAAAIASTIPLFSPPKEEETAKEDLVIPPFSGSAHAEINGNQPFFDASELTGDAFETYSELDALGRCGAACANVCAELMPEAEREPIGDVKPSGWHLVKYNGIEDAFLYNRCHLIGYQLTGENANERNLITGTRYMNVEGMLPYENRVANYVRDTGHHVLYRITPIFTENNLLCDGVLIEAQSVEDNGLAFCVFCYNVQPGIEIDYATGESSGPEYTGQEPEKRVEEQSEEIPEDVTYVANRNSFKFHDPACEGVHDMALHNRVFFYGEREDVIAQGYEPCRMCNP